jgi:hypothetical protein
VSAEVDDLQRHLAHPYELSIFDSDAGDWECVRVGGMCDGLGVREGDDVLEGVPVVVVLVRGDHCGDSGVTDEVEQPVGLVGRVDEELLTGCAAAQQIGVVVHRANGKLSDAQVRQLSHVRRSAGGHISGVGHKCDPNPTPVRLVVNPPVPR